MEVLLRDRENTAGLCVGLELEYMCGFILISPCVLIAQGGHNLHTFRLDIGI